jgi:hypothetical protein
VARRQKNWRKYLQTQRRLDRYGASIEAQSIEARLRAQLPPRVWDEVEATWATMDDWEAYLPQQRRDYLIKVADQHDVSLAGIEIRR